MIALGKGFYEFCFASQEDLRSVLLHWTPNLVRANKLGEKVQCLELVNWAPS